MQIHEVTTPPLAAHVDVTPDLLTSLSTSRDRQRFTCPQAQTHYSQKHSVSNRLSDAQRCQSSGGKPPLMHVCVKNVSRFHPNSTGTWGSSSPLRLPLSTSTPCRPTSISPGSETGSKHPSMEISNATSDNSCKDNAANHGSRVAASPAQRQTTSFNGS